jgi:sodium/proline symporter
MSLLTSASPSSTAAGVFGDSKPYGFLTIISTLAWGLGYFGMPQVLLRFMCIRSEKELTSSRRIAIIWCVISMFCAVAIGIIGRSLFFSTYATNADAENVFILMATTLVPPLVAGLVCAGILAASISSSDSYLLISASAISKNVWQGLIRKDASDKEVMTVSRIVLILVTAVAAVMAMEPDSPIFVIVSFAWAGFGAAFGPLMLFSLFWRRINLPGAIAGMVTGGAMVFIWKFLVKPLGGVFGIYELLPAFICSCIAIVVVSLLTKENKELEAEFDSVNAKSYQ